MAPQKRKIIALDFDGVLHSYKSGWQGARNIPDPPVKGAIEWLVNFIRRFGAEYEINIYSSRSKYFGSRKAMRKWLHSNILDFLKKEGNYLPPDPDLGFQGEDEFIMAQIKFPLFKPPAFLTIDDRAIRFNGDFKVLNRQIFNFTPWYWEKKGRKDEIQKQCSNV